MKKIELEVIGLSSGQTQGSYTLILNEVGGKRKLAIIIGSFEAQAIAIEIEKITPFRPMTHDLFVSMGKAFNISMAAIEIYNLVEGVFYAKLILDRNGEVQEIDARTSDAIALAVRYKCMIFTSEEIMEQASYEFPDDSDLEEEIEKEEKIISEKESKKITESRDDLKSVTDEDLRKQLDDAISREDYQTAALIRDELNRRG